MSSEVDKLAVELLGLPASARAELARKLIASLDEEEDGDVEALWVHEAQRRLSELREGKVKGEPAESAINALRALKV